MPVLIAALVCFASFGWGMARHFKRVGKPTRWMMLTAVLALAGASLQIFALVRKPVPEAFAALVLYCVSATLFWLAISATRGQLAACGQGCVSTRIVTAGPYRYVRHPFYTSYNLTWIAGFAATGWWPLAVSAVLMAWVYERSAREEERGFLSGPLAREYRAYMLAAGRYLPHLIPERSHADNVLSQTRPMRSINRRKPS
jgi:protein-S-isoprenylcysteine O-methyltransferase Ste14